MIGYQLIINKKNKNWQKKVEIVHIFKALV